MQSLLAAPFLIRNPENLVRTTRKEIGLILFSACCMSVGSYTSYWCLEFIPILDATVLFNAQTVVVFLLSSIWLKEKLGLYETTMMIFVLLGVVAVCQPTFLFGFRNPEDYNGLSLSWYGYLMASITTICLGVTTCCIKRVQAAGPSVILTIQGVLIIPLELIIGIITKDGSDPADSSEWLYLFGSSVLSSFARTLLTCALMYEESSFISIIATTEIIFSMILQILIFHIYPNWFGMLGTLLIVLGILCLKFKDKVLGKCTNNKSEEATNLI